MYMKVKKLSQSSPWPVYGSFANITNETVDALDAEELFSIPKFTSQSNWFVAEKLFRCRHVT